MIINEGQDAAFKEINNKEGKFVWKDQSNPPKQPNKEMVDLAKDKGEGWVEYMFPKPGEEAPSKKISYIYRVPGQNLLVGAGIYE
jgi:signal transduction histidine kinase